MSANPWYHSNRYNQASSCQCCGQPEKHEPWCVTCNPEVRYAYAIATWAEKLSEGDSIILHALGATYVR